MLANIKRFFTSIVISMASILVCFGIMDGVWLGWIAKQWYTSEMSSLLREQFITWPWLVFYVLYGGVIFVLTVVANREKPWYYAGIDGGLLGLAAYGAYNLTNYSILEGFTLKIMLIDWAWGVTVTTFSAISGWIGFQVATSRITANSSD